MRKVQWLMRQGVLATSERARRLHTQASKLVSGPMCAACQYAKQRRKTTPGTTKKVTPGSHNMLKTNDLFPGSKISVDHFEANPRGRLLVPWAAYWSPGRASGMILGGIGRNLKDSRKMGLGTRDRFGSLVPDDGTTGISTCVEACQILSILRRIQ